MAFEFIQQALQKQHDHALFRDRALTEQCLNFSANDYLGFAHHPEVILAWQQGAQQYGVGSTGSPLVTGHTKAHAYLEEKLADITGYESCLLFNTGYSANQALLKALLNKTDLLVQDKLNHASLIEAGMQSASTLKRFKHNDLSHLSSILATRSNYTNSLVITEGVFSMDGDQANLSEIVRLAKENNSWVMVDDAHGFGVMSSGKGSVQQQGLSCDDVNLYMATFGKAIGVSGAFIAANKDVIDYMVNFSKPYIYSTAMPAAMAHSISTALDLMETEGWRFSHLQDLISYFRQECERHNITLMPSSSPIQPLIIGDAAKALAVSQQLLQRGILVKAIRPPTVPLGSARLRITLSAEHSKTDIDLLLQALQEVLNGY